MTTPSSGRGATDERMVLAAKVGKKRPFWRGFLLTLFTVGIYGLYWNYRATDELYKQFELHREKREEGIAWYIVGLALFPLQFVYYYMMVDNVRYVRRRLGFSRSTRPTLFVAAVAVGLGAYFVGALTLFTTVGTLPADAPDQRTRDALGLGSGAFVGGVVIALLVLPFAYARLQREINEVWDAYDARVAELTAEARDAPA